MQTMTDVLTTEEIAALKELTTIQEFNIPFPKHFIQCRYLAKRKKHANGMKQSKKRRRRYIYVDRYKG